MLNLKSTLAGDIAEGVKSAFGKAVADEGSGLIVVERTESQDHGDYASPVALGLAKKLKKKPLEIVEAIAAHMPKKEYIGKLEAAAPGFLNIWISDEWLVSRLDDIIEENIFLDVADVGQERLVNLEFISANPTGPLTLGNARTAFSADTLANVLAAAGFNVTREYYINDAGSQIARLGESVLRRILQMNGLAVEFAEDLYQGDYVKDIATTLAEQWKENEGKEFTAADLENKDLLDKISHEAMELCLGFIKQTIHDDLQITFDVWTSEQTLRNSGKVEKVLDKLRQGKLTYQKDGAEYLQTTKFGDDEDRVLVKKNGEYAYIVPDIAYHQDKFDRQFDLIFTFVGADHQGHVVKLQRALAALGNDVNKLHFVVAQWLALTQAGKEFKPSKRRGEIYGAKDLIAEITYDAARFFMIQHSLASHMTLDLDLAKEKSERNPVYYIQYAYVRLQSILRKAKERGLIDGREYTLPDGSAVVRQAAENNLMRVMYQLPETVVDVAHSFEVHDLAYYAQNLAKAVHLFYRDVPVLAEKDKDAIASRLQLVTAASKVLGATLDLLGIAKPDVM